MSKVNLYLSGQTTGALIGLASLPLVACPLTLHNDGFFLSQLTAHERIPLGKKEVFAVVKLIVLSFTLPLNVFLCWEAGEGWNVICHLPIRASKPREWGVVWHPNGCCSEILLGSSPVNSGLCGLWGHHWGLGTEQVTWV